MIRILGRVRHVHLSKFWCLPPPSLKTPALQTWHYDVGTSVTPKKEEMEPFGRVAVIMHLLHKKQGWDMGSLRKSVFGVVNRKCVFSTSCERASQKTSLLNLPVSKSWTSPSKPWSLKEPSLRNQFSGNTSFFCLPAACRLFSRGVIFTRARVSHALLSLRKNGGLLVV